jgi:hypothetical protein
LTNRDKRREKVVRTPGYEPKAWVKVFATVAVLGLFFMAALAGVFSQ